MPPTHVESMQPDHAKERPPPVRPERAETPVGRGGPTCTQCNSVNDPGRRFCAHCGAVLDPSGTTGPAGMAYAGIRLSWWQRLMARLRGDHRDVPMTATGTSSSPARPVSDADRRQQAKAAYRQALDVRYRVFRVMALFGVVGVLAASMGVAGVSPIGWARDRWRDLFPRYDYVEEVTATVDPATLERPDFPGTAAVDEDHDSAWGTGWQLAPDADPAKGCGETPGTGGAETALVLTLPEPSRVDKFEIQAGLPKGDPDRPNQWRPTLVEVRFDDPDATCEVLKLSTEAGFQSKKVEVEDVTSIRMTILDAAPPTSAAGNLVTFGEIRVYSRSR